MASEMVERAAAVFAAEARRQHAAGEKADVRAAMYLAIEALLVPTDAMEDAGIFELDRLTGENRVKREHLDGAYTAMIIAALKAPKPPSSS